MKNTQKPTKPEETQALRKQETTAISEQPDFIKKSARGLESADSGDITIPRISICQTLTPARKRDNSAYIVGLDEGDLFNTVTKQVYGRELEVIPITFFKNRIKFKEPIGTGIECVSMNGINGGRLSPTCASCEFSQFGENSAPACTNIANFLVMLMTGEVAIVSLKSTAIKVAKDWNAMMRIKGVDTFARTYRLSVVPVSKNNMSYYQFKVTDGAWVSAEAYDSAERLHTSMAGKTIAVDESEASSQAETEDIPF